jgi:hypothetical protein
MKPIVARPLDRDRAVLSRDLQVLMELMRERAPGALDGNGIAITEGQIYAARDRDGFATNS